MRGSKILIVEDGQYAVTPEAALPHVHDAITFAPGGRSRFCFTVPAAEASSLAG